MDLKEKLQNFLDDVEEVDGEYLKNAQLRLDSLVKPIGSLGKLEEIAARLASINKNLYCSLDKRCLIIMASDNGVVEEGVASAPQEVTYIQTLNFSKGITGAAVLSNHFNTDMIVVDVGVNQDINDPNVINKKMRKSTHNIAKQAAMSLDEAHKAVIIGIELAIDAKNQGYNIIGVGEMGIGNTTTSSAVLSSLLAIRGYEDVRNTVGRGAGLTDERYENKIKVIEKAIELHNPDAKDPMDVLHKVGGFDIAAMAGVFIGAAYCKIPVVVDGFISIVAALLAYRLNPKVKGYMFASHLSCERGYVLAMDELGIEPCLNLDMRLGEGSGCPIMFSIMDAACAIIKDMGTFEEADIGTEYLDNLSK